MNDLFSEEKNVLYYGEYVIRKQWNPETESSVATVSRKGKVLVRHTERNARRDTTKIALTALSGKKGRQLIIQQYSGGAHCCLSWWFYELHPKIRLIFSSDDYTISDAMYETKLMDLNNDGQLELVAHSNRFAYFDELCFTCSSLPEVIFRYDKSLEKYRPANPEFVHYLFRDLEADRNTALKEGRFAYGLVLNVLLRYLYAGRERSGWIFFNRAYGYKKDGVKIRQHLQGDSFYRFVKARYSERK